MKTIFEVAKIYRGENPEWVSHAYVNGWYVASVVTEGIRLAIEKVGLENLTGAAAREGLCSIEDFDIGMGTILSMNNNKPYFASSEQISQVRQGKVKPVSDWLSAPKVSRWLD